MNDTRRPGLNHHGNLIPIHKCLDTRNKALPVERITRRVDVD